MNVYLTPRQVADRWGCSARHVRRQCASGELRAMRLGLDAWRISVASAEAYELAHTSGQAITPTATAPEPVRPVFGVLAEATGPLVLPERWWESQPTTGAASSAAGRGRTPKTKKAALSSH